MRNAFSLVVAVRLVFTLALCPSFLAATSVTARADQGWQAKVDLLLLAPKISETGVKNIFYYDGLASSSEESGNIESEIEFAQRVTLGYEGSGLGGAQIRWFTFDQELPYVGLVEESPPVSLSGGVNLDVDAIDAELTQRGSFGTWNWLATAGARYARLSLREQQINFEDLDDIVWFGSTGVQFEGAGPTVSVSGTRPVLADGFAIFGGARTALLYGDTDLFSAFRSGGVYSNPNDFVQVWEIQLGTQMNKRFESLDLLTAVFWEAQRWDSDSDLLGDIGFHGFGVQTGIQY